jgi:hypothetical protein
MLGFSQSVHHIDNALTYQVPGQTVSHAFTLGSGAHYVVAKGWDRSGNNWWKGENITVKWVLA